MPRQDSSGRWISDDGLAYWDGSNWLPIGAAPAPPAAPMPPPQPGMPGTTAHPQASPLAYPVAQPPSGSPWKGVVAQQSRHLSPDGGWQWTGTQWVPNTQAPTQTGHLSPDGRWLWTGIQWVPNTQASVQSGLPLWARAYESARTRSNLVTIFLLGNLLGLLVGMIFDVVDIDYLQTTTPSDSLTFADGLLAIVYVLAFYGTLIPAVVFFCMWLHRVVRNMPALGAADPRWSPAGTVGRSFIPILNLAHPMSGTLEAWRGSDSTRRWIDVKGRKAMRPPKLIVGWWTLWLIGVLASRSAFRTSFSSNTSVQVAGAWFDIVSNLVLVGAAILAALVVRDVTARQDRKNDLIASGELA